MLYHSHTFKFTHWKSLSNVSKFAFPPIKIRFEREGVEDLFYTTVCYFMFLLSIMWCQEGLKVGLRQSPD